MSVSSRADGLRFGGSMLTGALLLGLAGVAYGQHKLRDYQEVARRAFKDDLIEHTHPSVVIRNGTISFSPGTIDYQPVEEGTSLNSHFMREVLQVELMRHTYPDYGRGGMNSQFWEEHLRYIDRLIERDMAAVNADHTAETRDKIIFSRPVHEFLDDKIREFAEQQGLQVQPRVEPSPMLLVDIRTSPKNLNIKMAHALDWFVLQKQGIDPKAALSQIAVGEKVRLYTGAYIVSIEQGAANVVPPRLAKIPMCDVITFFGNGAIQTLGDGKGRLGGE